MNCQIDKLTGTKCNNPSFANITVNGTKGSVTLEICQQHLKQLSKQATSTTHGPQARKQLGRG